VRFYPTASLMIAAALVGPAPAAFRPAIPAAEPALADAHPTVPLRRFSSASEFDLYLEEIRERRRRESAMTVDTVANAAEAAIGEPVAVPGSETGEEFELSGAVNVEQVINNLPQVIPQNPEITNNQSVGVDEGGIVKQIGRFLIVLQDGRLFSADLGGSSGPPLRLAGRIDVYRSRDTAADWYDEMLVIGNRILVTAYSYEHSASEISIFTLDGAGRFTREGRWLLSSDDYYSTENYATRLVGDNLVFYAPIGTWQLGGDGQIRWPRLRRAPRGGAPDEGETLIGPTEIYAPVGEPDFPVVHTLSICPIRGEIECRSTAFVGAAVREVYVSPTDAFLWLGAPDGLPWSIEYANERRRDCAQDEHFDSRANQAALLYRVPLDGSDVGAVGVDGVPENQFAFDSRGGRFRALLSRSDGNCRKSEGSGPLALLDLPLSAFGSSVGRVSASAYSALPPIDAGNLENRFVGDWLIYGGRTRWSGLDEGEARRPAASTLWTVPLARPQAPVRIDLPHNALRIERAGMDAVVTGYSGADGLNLSYVTLGAAPRLSSTAFLPGRFESEGRSHAFGAWMRQDGSGLIGLPTTRRRYRAGRGWSDSESSELSYVRIGSDRMLAHAGELRPGRRRVPSAYRCEVSCVDWYGNSRPIFTGGRIFALMATDLVEGRLISGRIAETGRVDLTGPVRP
jgi:hypothetical protein